VAEVAGYIWETNLDDFVQLVAAYVDYRWDGLDDDALVGALDVTDAEKPDAWFDYPIVGSPPVTLALARDWGSAKLGVRITGAFDIVLAALRHTARRLLSESSRTRVERAVVTFKVS
jgi:hypothetical protein